MRVSAKSASAIVAVAIAVGVHGFQQSGLIPPDETVQKRYQGADGTFIEVVGVCHVTEDSVECWDVEGAHHARLTEAVENSLTGGRNRGRLTIQYGKKNRYVVVRSVRGPRGRYVTVETGRRNGSNGGSFDLGTLVEDVSSSVNIEYRVIGLFFEQDSTETFVELIETFNINARTSFFFRKGEEFSLNGVTHVLEEPKRMVANTFGESGSAWTVSVKSDGEALRTYHLGGHAIDKDGETIHYVNEKGRPLSTKEYEARLRELRALGVQSSYRSPNSYVSVNLADNGRKGSITTNVDPKYMKEVRITVIWNRRIRIEGIPLDPVD